MCTVDDMSNAVFLNKGWSQKDPRTDEDPRMEEGRRFSDE
jgi:hypothetical protein